MSDIKSLVGRVLTGQLKLDVPTAKKIIKEASRDGRIDGAAELAPLKELFAGDLFKQGVTGTTSGKKLLQGFVINAEKLHDRVGDGKSSQVQQLKTQSVDYAAHQLLSKEAVLDLLTQYRGTTADDPRYASVNSTTSIREVTPRLAEAWRRAAEKDLTRYLEGGPVSRFLMRVGVGKEFIDRVYENDPQDYIRRYLETYSTPRASGGGVPLDEQVRHLEITRIKDALLASGGDHAATALRLGLEPATLERKMAAYGIP